jgi:tetratricopeptide (TPR) repeat protein
VRARPTGNAFAVDHEMKKLFLILCLLLGMSLTAPAQGPLMATFEEQQALADIEGSKLVHLRELAQKMLNDPKTKDRYQTYFFMGYVLHHAEGDLPRSRWYLEEGLKKFEASHGKSPYRNAPWGWVEKIIMELAAVTGEMDLYEEQMAVYDRVAELYKAQMGMDIPMLQAYYSWPLMKLGREQEARDRLRIAMSAPQGESVLHVLNSLGALEMETDHPKACYEAFHRLLDEVRDNGYQMTNTYLRNTGEAAACLLKFDEAERLFLEATEYFDPESFSNPWWDLSTMYLSQGRFPEAVSALKKTHKWTFDSQPHLAQQTWAANQQLTCEILLQLGMTEEALRIANGFVDRPDRKGGDSVQRDQWEAANMIIYREAALARRQAIREEMLWTRGWAWWKMMWQQRDLTWQAYLKGQQAASSIVSHGRILSCLRYAYAPGTVLIPNYVRLEMPTLLGPGTVLAALDQLEAKKFESLPYELPYLKTIRFESLALLGRDREALALLREVEKELPVAEVLLRTRVMARAAQIYLRDGDMAKALPYLQQVMDRAPVFLRNLGIALPASFQSDGSALADSVVGICQRSPRFSEESGAFRVSVTSSGATLLGPDGTVLSRFTMEKLKKGEDATAALARSVHERFFAAPIDLTQLDISSLDGVVTGAVQSKQMQEMFFPGSTRPDES